MNKRGISAVVATVLIILLVVSGVGIVWLGIMPMIADINIDKSAGLRLVSSEGHTLWDPESRLATVQIERVADGPDVYGIDIVFSFSGNSVTHFVEDVPGLNGKRVYHVNLSEYSGDLDSIKIVPIFWGGIVGDVASELKIERIPEADIAQMIEEEVIDAEEFVEPTGYSGGGGGSSSNNGGSSGGGNNEEVAVCGNDVIESGETCDGVNLNLQNCSSQGFGLGNLSCLNDCFGYNVGECVSADSVCGDEVCNSSEDCGNCEGDCGVCEETLIKPIARTDVVPYQRIDYGTDFKFGVVAFSKPGINKVEFDIVGQGYSGDLKVSTEMTLNTRVASAEYDGVWEYWVWINASEFSGNGEINITPTVYDNDGRFRELVTSVLIVEGASADFNRSECWVNAAGSGGSVGDEGDPFPNIVEAIDACEAANGGDSSGNIIYLAEGVYEASDFFATVSGNEWLTFTKAEGANRNNVIVRNNGGGYTYENWLKFDDVTLQSGCEGCIVFRGNDQGFFYWTNHTRRIGAGRRILNSNPVFVSRQADLDADLDGYYSTDDYTYDIDYAYHSTDLIRGAVVDTVSDDVFENFQFVVNARVSNQSNGAVYNETPESGATSAHGDVLQVYDGASLIPVENRLAFNVYATDIHYEGIMRESTFQPARNNAFVNVFIEMREPTTDGDATNGLGNDSHLMAGIIGTPDNESHLLLWHNSFPYAHLGQWSDPKDSSFYGNLFWALSGSETYSSTTEWAYNHFMVAPGFSDACDPLPEYFVFKGWTCPGGLIAVGDDYTAGGGVVDITDPDASDFGYPVEGSVLIDRLPEMKVPCDVFGNARDAMPDVGAVEFV